MTTTTTITKHEYVALDNAYKDFNLHLFAGKLPECLITLNRHPKARGFFCANRFSHREQDRRIAEIALNPDTFEDRTDLEVLSTLVHEMVHLWQHYFGRPSRGGYHNREWATKMEKIGLMPSSTGAPGGKRTGQHVSHYILADQQFAVVAQQIIGLGFRLNWQSPTGPRAAKAQTRKKFSCYICTQAAWAKPTAQLVCGYCNLPMTQYPEAIRLC